MRINTMYPGVFLVALCFGWQDASSQQESRSGAVEEFAPAIRELSSQTDVGFEMRPRVGLFGITELMMAALEADLDEVKRLVEQGTSVDETDDTGGTPLMWAVQGGNTDVVDYLIDHGADINAVGGRNVTALMIAVTSGKEDIGIRLLEAGATFAGELRYQQDYLEYAAANRYAKLVRALIEHGANLEGSGPDALCFAIQNRGFEAAKALIDAGVDVNQPGNHNNDLPIVHAVKSGNTAFIEMLVESGAELNRKDKMNRASIMYYAARSGLPSIVSYLLDNGASLSEDEAQGLLSHAVYQGSIEMVDLFVKMGATISAEHIFTAVTNKHHEMVDAFIDVIGIESMDDYTLDVLVDHAKMHGRQELVDELLDFMVAQQERGHLRLLFETNDTDKCSLKTWDPEHRAVSSTVFDGYPCAAELFTSRRNSSLFVVHKDRIDVRSIDNRFPAFTLDVPTEEIDARRRELGRQFAEWLGDGSEDSYAAEIITVGYLENGQITVITHTVGPADGTYASQFAWDGDTWTLVDTQNCGRFDWICHKAGVDGRSIDRWSLRRAVWHAALQRNRGFVEHVIQGPAEAGGEWRSAVVFEFGGQRSELEYKTSGSDHCDGVCVFTDSVTINSGGADPIPFNLAYSRVSIADRFILLRPYPTTLNTRLYDLVTGEDILSDISRASWID